MNNNNVFVRAYVAFMKKFFPSWVVKNKLLKTNAYHSYWFMGKDELKAIKKLDLSVSEIQERRWSLPTRVEYLKKDSYILLDDINSIVERDVIVENALNHEVGINANVLVKAFRTITPSAEQLKKIIEVLDNDMLCEVAQQFPKLFNDVKPHEIFGLNINSLDMEPDDEDIEKITAKRCNLAIVLSKNFPQFAVEFMVILSKASKGKLAEDRRGVFEELFKIAFKNNLDMSRLILRLYDEFPQMYAILKKTMSRNNHAGNYVYQMWGKVIEPHYDAKTSVSKFLLKDVKGDDKQEAVFWMEMVFCNLGNVKVMKTVVSRLSFLKKVLTPALFEQMIVSIARCYHEAYQGLKILEYTKEPNNIHDIYERLVEVANLTELVKLFPFNDMTEEQKKKAISKLVKGKMFPVEKFDALEETLKEFTRQQIFSQSEILILESGCEAKWRELLSLSKLTEDAELFMLGTNAEFAKLKIEYIQKFGLGFKGFNKLLSMKSANFETGCSYLWAYCQRCGITDEDLFRIMQSQYAERAPYLKQFLKND